MCEEQGGRGIWVLRFLVAGWRGNSNSHGLLAWIKVHVTDCVLSPFGSVPLIGGRPPPIKSCPRLSKTRRLCFRKTISIRAIAFSLMFLYCSEDDSIPNFISLIKQHHIHRKTSGILIFTNYANGLIQWLWLFHPRASVQNNKGPSEHNLKVRRAKVRMGADYFISIILIDLHKVLSPSLDTQLSALIILQVKVILAALHKDAWSCFCTMYSVSTYVCLKV